MNIEQEIINLKNLIYQDLLLFPDEENKITRMSDIIKELLDEDAFDPKKLFNEEEYSTLIIAREGFSKKENNDADLIESLLEKEITRQESEAIFLKLKESNSVDVMVNAIKKAGRVDEKIILAAAGWESCLDFTNHFLFQLKSAKNRLPSFLKHLPSNKSQPF